MLRFFAQPQFTAARELSGYELFLKEKVGDCWRVPTDFEAIPVADVEPILMASLAELPRKSLVVSINFDQSQFVERRFVEMMARVRPHFPHFDLFVELTEYDQHVTPEALRDAAAAFIAVDIHVCLDDVGFGANNDALSLFLDPYVGEYKFAIQNFKGEEDCKKNSVSEIKKWSQRAKARLKRMTIEGIEDAKMNEHIQAYTPDMLQGYYFGKPEIIDIDQITG